MEVDKTMDPILDKAMEAMKTMTAGMPAEARASLPTREKMKEQMKTEMASGVLEVKSDGTFTMSDPKNTGTTGTWTESGGAVTFTPKTHDGKPAEGEHAKAMTANLEGSNLVLKMDAPPGTEKIGLTEIKIYFKRK